MSHSQSSCIPSALLVEESAGSYRPAKAEEVLQAAQQLLQERIRRTDVFGSTGVVRDYLRVRLGALEHEVFAVLHLDSQNRLIKYVEMFRGTVSQTSVYPREVVKEALSCNSAAVVLVHNHPSGVSLPSRADEMLTQRLKAALTLVDVRVLDHWIIAGPQMLSFAEEGLL